MHYYRYLASRAWRLKRKDVLARCNNICERCGDAPASQVHHLTYRHVGDEPIEELQGICRMCHEYVSGEGTNDPAQIMVTRLLTIASSAPEPVGPGDNIFWWDIGPTRMGVHIALEPLDQPVMPVGADEYRGAVVGVKFGPAWCWWM